MPPAAAASRQQRRCAATAASGQPCGAPALRDGAYCFTHDPDRAAERQAARVKGGENRATIVRAAEAPVPSYLKPVLSIVIKSIIEVRDGSMSPAQGASVAALAGVVVRLVAASGLEERLSLLEERLQWDGKVVR